jgi:predicted AlkP superfamily pyrophosphatase or phosphodiesterase
VVTRAAANDAKPSSHVVIVSLDGFPASALADLDQPLPSIRRLARDGAMAAAMRPVNPTVTWPNHTSIVTGVGPDAHTVLYNGQARRAGAGQPVTIEARVPKDELVRGTTLYDAAFDAGLTTAEVDWVAIDKARTITWSFPEWGSTGGPLEREMVEDGRIAADELARFEQAPITFKDELWLRVAEYLLEKKQPNLTLVHLLTTDSVQHRHGPDDVGASAALALADAAVARLVEAVRRGGTLERTTFFVVSDHGFRRFTRSIHPNAVLARRGLAGVGWSLSEGGTAMLFVTAAGDTAAHAAAMRAALAGVEGVARILGPSEFAAEGYPQPSAVPGMADLVLVAREGYAFGNAVAGEAVVDEPGLAVGGSHGYLRDDPAMQALFVAWGAGVKAGVRLGSIQNLDVAPTAARLLDVRLPHARGRVLEEILR